MKLLFNIEGALKHGLYLDFIFKNFIFFFYKKLIGKNFLFLTDKYFTEYFFLLYRFFCNYLLFLVDISKNLKFNECIKIIVILIIQVIIIIVL
jgi:hypothetical protein